MYQPDFDSRKANISRKGFPRHNKWLQEFVGRSEETTSKDRTSRNTPKITPKNWVTAEKKPTQPCLWSPRERTVVEVVASASGCHGSALDWPNPPCTGAMEKEFLGFQFLGAWESTDGKGVEEMEFPVVTCLSETLTWSM